MESEYIPVIGLEVHIQLNTNSKLFCDDFNEFGSEPNTNVSTISLAHPGTLPVLNKAVLEKAIKLGRACRSKIADDMIFDRKNYFYPDLPKGYQITQDRTPVCKGGFIPVKLKSGGKKDIILTKIHIEEDAGKSIHVENGDESLLDFNRAGVPLLEMVTDPVLCSAEEASSFLYEVRRLVRYLEVSDGNMEEGSLRCDANISVKKETDSMLGSKVEVKNLNSMKNVQKAIDYEIKRQIEALEKGDKILSETRMFNAGNGKTYGLRDKETLNDYRYFPDPDLSPVHLTKEFIEDIVSDMTDTPWEIEEQLEKDFNLPEYDAVIISENRQLVLFFKNICKFTSNYKAASNWIMGPIKSYLNVNKLNILDFPIEAEKMGTLINLIDGNKLSFSEANKLLFPALIKHSERDIEELLGDLNLTHSSKDDEVRKLIREVIEEYPDEAEALKGGKTKLIGMFMGHLMRKSGGKLNPKTAKELLLDEIG